MLPLLADDAALVEAVFFELSDASEVAEPMLDFRSALPFFDSVCDWRFLLFGALHRLGGYFIHNHLLAAELHRGRKGERNLRGRIGLHRNRLELGAHLPQCVRFRLLTLLALKVDPVGRVLPDGTGERRVYHRRCLSIVVGCFRVLPTDRLLGRVLTWWRRYGSANVRFFSRCHNDCRCWDFQIFLRCNDGDVTILVAVGGYDRVLVVQLQAKILQIRDQRQALDRAAARVLDEASQRVVRMDLRLDGHNLWLRFRHLPVQGVDRALRVIEILRVEQIVVLLELDVDQIVHFVVYVVVVATALGVLAAPTAIFFR
uniref:Uncharacterized protein n=1 Tax=Anopheles atroparvus TaxID=41427 RepID=A0A182IQ28_ANOAO